MARKYLSRVILKKTKKLCCMLVLMGGLFLLAAGAFLAACSPDSPGSNTLVSAIQRHDQHGYDVVIKTDQPFYVGALPYVLIINGQEFSGCQHGYSGEKYTMIFSAPVRRLRTALSSTTAARVVLGYGQAAAREAYAEMAKAENSSIRPGEKLSNRSWSLGYLTADSIR